LGHQDLLQHRWLLTLRRRAADGDTFCRTRDRESTRRSERLEAAAAPGVDSISLELASALRQHPAQVASAATRHEADVGQAHGSSTALELAARAGDWTRPDGITVFKSVGTAVQDLVAAHVVATAARYRDREDPPRRGA
jgi:hypothetical protein